MGKLSGWQRVQGQWGGATSYLVLTAAGVTLAVGILVKIDPIPSFMWAIVAYTLYAALITGAVGIGLAVTRQPPGPRAGAVDGRPAEGITAWPWDWRHGIGIDLGLTVLAFVLTGLAFAAGGVLVVLILPVTAAGGWYVVTIALAVAGRRRCEALWLTDTHVVHDSIAGRVRVKRGQVTDVQPVNGWVFVVFDGKPEQTIAPRPWRPRHRLNRRKLMVNLDDMASEAAETVSWLRAELGLDRPQVIQSA